jgi:TRAP-type C4-dicarboxylate transport system permease small subunit
MGCFSETLGPVYGWIPVILQLALVTFLTWRSRSFVQALILGLVFAVAFLVCRVAVEPPSDIEEWTSYAAGIPIITLANALPVGLVILVRFLVRRIRKGAEGPREPDAREEPSHS